MTTSQQPIVLVIEDEDDVLDLVRLNLTRAGFRVRIERNGLSGLQAARREPPDVIVLDLMMPEMSGEEVCREIKQDEATADVPVLMLTAKASPEERIAGLELGADDYLTKPFSPRELVLRVEAVLRRTQVPGKLDIVKLGPFELDRGSFAIRMDGTKLDLTSIEFKLLAMLMENRGRSVERDALLRDVWGYRNFIDTRTVDTHMRRLRTKLGEHAGWLETVRGEGYRFRALDE